MYTLLQGDGKLGFQEIENIAFEYVTVLRKRYILRAKMKIELLIPRCRKFPGL